jgi:small subunit ribosomal protein S4
MGLAPTIGAARQFVNHGHITVNGKVVDIPSFQCQLADVISVKPKATSRKLIETHIKTMHPSAMPEHVTFNPANFEGIVKNYCYRSDILVELNELLVIEYYSRR